MYWINLDRYVVQWLASVNKPSDTSDSVKGEKFLD